MIFPSGDQLGSTSANPSDVSFSGVHRRLLPRYGILVTTFTADSQMKYRGHLLSYFARINAHDSLGWAFAHRMILKIGACLRQTPCVLYIAVDELIPARGGSVA